MAAKPNSDSPAHGQTRKEDIMNDTELMRKRKTADEIAAQINDGWVCFSDIGVSNPPELTDALAARAAAGEVSGIRWHSILDIEPLDILKEPAHRGITPVSWFSGKGFSKAVNEHRADLLPCSYKDMPEYAAGQKKTDALLLRTSMPDADGNFCAGTSGSMLKVLFEKAEHIYLEANKNMPFLPGAMVINIDRVDAYCVSERKLPEVISPEGDEVSRKIAGLIASEIPDRSTIQLGIGAIPEAVGALLKDKHDLGIHTELFGDSMMELIECGAVTNAYKETYTGKSVTTVAFGSERLYRFLDNNQDILILPVNITNDPYNIAKHKNFMSVNGALEVDFYGQVCAESIGMRHISGSGGQPDFVRGAVMSEGGKSFIAFPSTAAGGKLSRIKPVLTEGAAVTTGKNDVDMIVTEYGIAKLRGKTLSERVKALISVAHPDFRDELIFEAKKAGL